MLFKKNKSSTPGATPATPKIGSIALPGRGYESDSCTKSTTPLKRTPLSENPAGRSTPLGTSTSRMKEVYTLPEETLRPRRDSTSAAGKPLLPRSRTCSSTSKLNPSFFGSSWWGADHLSLGPSPPGWAAAGIPIQRPKLVETQWGASLQLSGLHS